MDIVNCDKLITIQDLSNVIDEYINVSVSFHKKMFLKSVEISDNDNQFNIVFNKSQYSVIIPFNNELFENYKDYQEKAKRLAYKNKQNFSLDKMTEKIGELLKQYVPDFPKQVELKLPKLKKIED